MANMELLHIAGYAHQKKGEKNIKKLENLK